MEDRRARPASDMRRTAVDDREEHHPVVAEPSRSKRHPRPAPTTAASPTSKRIPCVRRLARGQRRSVARQVDPGDAARRSASLRARGWSRRRRSRCREWSAAPDQRRRARRSASLDRRERAVGAPPFLGPGVADPSLPFDRLGHAAAPSVPSRQLELARRRRLRQSGGPFPERKPDACSRPSHACPASASSCVLMAALMASNALAIDAMLPALPAIGEALGVAEDNRRQLVDHLLSARLRRGAALLRAARRPLRPQAAADRLPGPLRPVRARWPGCAGSFDAAARRALRCRAWRRRRPGCWSSSIVRDRFHGLGDGADHVAGHDRLHDRAGAGARLRPGACLLVATWRHIFIGLAVYGAGAGAVGAGSGCPRRLRPEDRRPLVAGADRRRRSRETLDQPRRRSATRSPRPWCSAALFAFISSIQQIVFDVFGRPELIGLVFACVAGPMAVTSYAQFAAGDAARRAPAAARAALACFTAARAAPSRRRRWRSARRSGLFVVLQALTMACFGLVGANVGALAMEPLGHIAGTASSVQGADRHDRRRADRARHRPDLRRHDACRWSPASRSAARSALARRALGQSDG